MADRYAFTSPFGQGSDPWFKVKDFGVTTTILVIATTVFTLVWWTVEGVPWTNLSNLLYIHDNILDGEVWRLVTWPFVNRPRILLIISLVFFYLFGTQLENVISKKQFALLTAALILLPALILTGVAEAFFSTEQIARDTSRLTLANAIFGISPYTLGIFVAYIALNPVAKFFFGIPAWVLGVGFVALRVMEDTGDRFWSGVIITISTTLVALLFMRAIGFAGESLNWIPRVPLPGMVTEPNQTRKSKRKKSHLQSIPTPLEEAEMDSLLDQVANDGYKSLTRDQKKKLKNHSKKLRGQD